MAKQDVDCLGSIRYGLGGATKSRRNPWRFNAILYIAIGKALFLPSIEKIFLMKSRHPPRDSVLAFSNSLESWSASRQETNGRMDLSQNNTVGQIPDGELVRLLLAGNDDAMSVSISLLSRARCLSGRHATLCSFECRFEAGQKGKTAKNLRDPVPMVVPGVSCIDIS